MWECERGQTTERPDGHSSFELQPNPIPLRILIATLPLLAEVELGGPDSRLFRNPYYNLVQKIEEEEEEELMV